MNAIAVTTETFDSEVLSSDEPVLVDFWASYCGPCRLLKPVLEEISSEGNRVLTVEISEEPEIAQRFGISAIPTVIRFEKGQAGNRLVGFRPKPELLRLLNNG